MKTSKRTATRDVWEAVHRGPIYCAPACGGGCTYVAHLDAHTNGKKLCALLNRTIGTGWKPDIWENLGWHYRAISACGRIKVHPFHAGSYARGYTAFLGEPDSPGGTWSAQASAPAASVRKVIAMAKAELDNISAIMTGLPT